ncbi:uncharacterized protein LOC106013821 [Aplysia californica]|uniref:Uncharacterized protein LOC106013821 n=1 Tax=Aplysia californica TaxID=6500 RepID=A0ABM1AE66_APLCA|nr:uncharacterized protein LOC106013821 [Aplysia californica]
MSYLPPSGRRDFTAYRLTDLQAGVEKDNPLFTQDRLQRSKPRRPELLYDVTIPPLTSKTEDWIVQPPSRYPTNGVQHNCPMRPFCLGPHVYGTVGVPDVRMRCCCTVSGKGDLRELPYSLPRECYDVRRRADWFNHWQEVNYHHSGALQNWEKMFGERYFYTSPKGKC